MHGFTQKQPSPYAQSHTTRLDRMQFLSTQPRHSYCSAAGRCRSNEGSLIPHILSSRLRRTMAYVSACTGQTMLLSLLMIQSPARRFISCEEGHGWLVLSSIRGIASCLNIFTESLTNIRVSVSAQLGLPPTIQLDRGLLESLASKPGWLPDTLYFQLHVSRQSFNICNTLGNSLSSSPGLLPEPRPIIRHLDEELQALESQLSRDWSKEDYIIFLGCRLLLHTFVLMAGNSSSAANALHAEPSQHWHVQAYMTASVLIQTATSVRDCLLFAPTRLTKSIINAIFFLLLLQASRKYHFVDESVVQNSIRLGRDLLQRFSITEGDSMTRTCALIDSLSKSSDQPSDNQTDIEELLCVKSRMGANLSLSTIMLARECARGVSQRQKSPERQEQISGTTWAVEELESYLDYSDFDWNDLIPGTGM